jgi:hypothetical protein
MKRGTTYILVVWMALLTGWTAFLGFEMLDRVPSSVAIARPAALDVNDPIQVRYEAKVDGETHAILIPESVPIWRYVEGRDNANAARLEALEQALESDLHRGDGTFHRTHELIDGKTW